jgi:hypothetical protein
MDIKEALMSLDQMDDEQWTKDGSPKLEVVSNLVGKQVSRAEVVDAAPKFSRENMDTSKEEKKPEPDGDATVAAESVPDEEPVPMDLSELIGVDVSIFAKKVLSAATPDELVGIEKYLEDSIQMIDKKINDLNEYRKAVRVNKGETKVWVQRLVKDVSNSQAIRDYLDNNFQMRMAKAAHLQNILGGAKLSDLIKLDPRSPIDRAMSRKTDRGTGRPGQKT